MSQIDEFKKFARFVLENDVKNKKTPALFDSNEGTFVAHESHLPDAHYEQFDTPSLMVDQEMYFFVKKIGGFQPQVVKG